MQTRKAPIFIVGSHRTGSTVWHNIIAMAPGVCRVTEMRFLAPWWQGDFRYFLKHQIGNLSHDANVEELVELMFSRRALPGLEGAFWRFENFECVDEEAFRSRVCREIKCSDRTIGAIFRVLLDEICRAQRCERYCVKFPVDEGHISALLQWYPDCRIVHITRDPRAIAMSRTNDPGGTALKIARYPWLRLPIRQVMLLRVIWEYSRTAKHHQRYRRLENYRLYRFEDLLADPRATVENLCRFVGIEFNEEMTHPERGIHQHQPSSITGKVRKALDPTAATQWRSVVSPSADALVTLGTRRSMLRLGYDPQSHPLFDALRNRQ